MKLTSTLSTQDYCLEHEYENLTSWRFATILTMLNNNVLRNYKHMKRFILGVFKFNSIVKKTEP